MVFAHSSTRRKSAKTQAAYQRSPRFAACVIKVNAADPGWVKTDMGSNEAPLEVEDGAKTSVRLATLPSDGPTGGFFHRDARHPW